MKKNICLLVALLLCATVLPLYSSADIILPPVIIIDTDQEKIDLTEEALGKVSFAIDINGTKEEKEAALGVIIEPIATKNGVDFTVTVTSEDIYKETISFEVYLSRKDKNTTVSLTATQTGELITGSSIIGKVTSYNPKNKTTIELKKDGEAVYTTEIAPTDGYDAITQQFSFDEIADGTYDLVVTKECHITYTVKNVIVNGEDIDLTASGKEYANITLCAGDVDGNGSINPTDVMMIRLASNINRSTDEAENKTADVDGNGSVNPTDVLIVRLATNINKGEADSTFDY